MSGRLAARARCLEVALDPVKVQLAAACSRVRFHVLAPLCLRVGEYLRYEQRGLKSVVQIKSSEQAVASIYELLNRRAAN